MAEGRTDLEYVRDPASATFVPDASATVALAVSTTSARIQVATDPQAGDVWLIDNAGGDQNCYVVAGDDTVTAAAPVIGSTAGGIRIPAGAIVSFRFPGATHIAAITRTGTIAELCITPGEGL